MLKNVLIIILDSKLDFNNHGDNKVKTCYKVIGFTKRLSVRVLGKALLTIYKSLISPYLHYGHILSDKPGKQKIYDELGLNTLIETR